MQFKKTLYFSSFIITTFTAFLLSSQVSAAPVSWHVTAKGGAALVQAGRLQTTAGGTAGSATPEYPTFDQLDMEKNSFWHLEIGTHFGPHSIVFATQQLNPSSAITNSRKLIVQNKTFTPGSRIHSKVRVNEYQLTYAYNFRINPQLTLSPSVGVDLWDFSLKMTSPTITGQVHRAYHKSALQFGGQLVYQPVTSWQLLAEIRSTLPVGTQPVINSIELAGKYCFFNTSVIDSQLVLAVKAESLTYDDHKKQEATNGGANTMSNSIRMRAFLPTLGMQFNF